VVSDCGAICDIHRHHQVVETATQAAALAVKNGCELNCGDSYPALTAAVAQGLISETEISAAVTRLMEARFRLGMFDPPEQVPYARIPYEVNDRPAHRALARRMARESLVLLKNAGGLLPLRRDVGALAVVGPTAESPDVLLGNYHGQPSRYATLLDGIRAAAGRGTRVWYAPGARLYGEHPGEFRDEPDPGLAEALAAVDRADVAVVCLGLSPALEGEEGDAASSGAGGDKPGLDLPACQTRLLQAVAARGKPVVLVLTGGSAMALNWAAEHVAAILLAWYPGEEGGHAVADVLFGRCNPAGRLPVTFVKSLDQLPPFEDYHMAGRTYRFMTQEPLYPFGCGLSYTRFEYSSLTLSRTNVRKRQGLTLQADVVNAGERAGDEVVQLYVSDVEASVPVPRRHLEGFDRIHLKPGQRKRVTFRLKPEQLAAYDDEGRPFVEPGEFRVWVGGGQPETPGVAGVAGTFWVV
jgi:beta-glucosidase